MGPAPKAIKKGLTLFLYPYYVIAFIIAEEQPEKKRLRAKVTYSYTPQNGDELKLFEGDIVEILQQVKRGFSFGELVI
jgi:hypothetical protein